MSTRIPSPIALCLATSHGRAKVVHLLEPQDSEQHLTTFARAVCSGLGGAPKTLPWGYFYDEAGSRLFDAICELPEYYLTRTEDAILSRHAGEMVDGLAGDGNGLRDGRSDADLLFPGGVTAEVAMARQERFAKSGARPQISPATIHEDLRGRDFTVNAIALSLNKASLGLVIDPTNGIGDIERKELRTIHNYSFYDDPARMVRLIRFQARLGYAVDERTRAHYENAREAEMLGKITGEALGAELRKMAEEPNAGDLIEGLEREKLLELYSPALAGLKTNLPTFQKLQKARQMAPVGIEFKIHPLPLFLNVLFEKLNAKERADLIKTAGLTKVEITAAQKLDAAAKKLERDLKGAKLQKASQLYQLMVNAPGEAVLYLVLHSQQRIVQDRIKNYFQKHLPASLEITNEMVVAAGAALGSPKFQKLKDQMIYTRLDARPKKPAPEAEPAPGPPMSSFARGPSVRHTR